MNWATTVFLLAEPDESGCYGILQAEPDESGCYGILQAEPDESATPAFSGTS